MRDEYEAGVLLIDHNMALIMEVCDRIHVLDQGRTLAEGTPQEIRANLDVTAAYLGESAVHEGAPMSMVPALELADLWVTYGSVPAVRKLDLTVGKGEIVGLIGPNGAGKSTTLHTITGMVRPQSGDIRLARRARSSAGSRRRSRGRASRSSRRVAGSSPN